jgi:hypothetical protein
LVAQGNNYVSNRNTPLAIEHTRNDFSEVMRALAMPFQLASLLFVLLTSVVLGFFIGGDLVRLVVSVATILLMLVWLTQYALHLIDDIANGVRESRAASVEMATSFLDARAWVHPALGVAVAMLLYLKPEVPVLPVLIGAALLFPASIGACAITGHALDALNPLELARVMRGFGIWYPLVAAFVLGCAVLGWLAARGLGSMILIVATAEMLLLLVYACIGGVLFVRRRELGFEPRQSPERIAQREEEERRGSRQQFVDGLYKDLRVRESARAAASAARWLRESRPENLKGDVHAILQAGVQWNEPREYPRFLRGLLPALLEMKQPMLAMAIVDAGLAAAGGFAPATEAETVALVNYAQHTGRRRVAQTLLGNYLKSAPAGEISAALRALQATVSDTA